MWGTDTGVVKSARWPRVTEQEGQVWCERSSGPVNVRRLVVVLLIMLPECLSLYVYIYR